MSNNPKITVDIHANTSALRNELNEMSNQIPNNASTIPLPSQNPLVNTPTTPTPFVNTPQSPVVPSERMVQDIRREIMSRGVMMVPGSSNFHQMMNVIAIKKREEINSEIASKYNPRWDLLESQKMLEEQEFLTGLESRKKERLSGITDPYLAYKINSEYEEFKRKGLKKIDEKYGARFDDLLEKEQSEKSQSEEELTKAIEILTEEIKRGNPNSYMSKLREEYRNAIWRRDNAETEEESQAAAAEAAAIQRRIGKATSPINRYAQLIGIAGGVNQVVGTIERGVDAWRQNSLLQIGEINSAANGDAFGAMQQDLERRRMNSSFWGGGIGTVVGSIVGGVAAALSSWGIGTGAGVGGGAAIGGVAGTAIANTIFNWTHAEEEREIKLGQLWQQQEQRIQQYNDISLAYRRNKDLSSRRKDWMYELAPNLNKMRDNVNFYDLGYTGSQFSTIMAQRVKQRGYISSTSDWDLENYIAEQVALERAYNMSEGSIAQLSAYDRYGNNANQDMANLIASLNNRKVLGMSGGQTLRANEFLGYQTQLMEMQKGWMDAPNANYAIRLLLAGQAAFGNNFDSRAISEIGQIENTVTHPKEDYSKALLYDVIQEIMPETKGNLLAIRQAQYSDDPDVRMRIQQAMAKKIQQVYGGLNTTSGYLAASHYYGIEDPERLRAIISQYEKGLPTVTEGDVQNDANILKGYTSSVSKSMLKYQDNTVLEISNQLGRLEDIGNKLLTSFNSMLRELINEFK